MAGLSDQGVPSPAMVAAWFVLGALPIERLPWWAAQWLADGDDSEALRELAGLDGRDPRAVRDLVPVVLAELQVPVPSSDLAAARETFQRIARLHVSGQASERWVAQKVEEILILTKYDSEVIALPLGQLYQWNDAWDQGWGPSVDELKAIVRTQCAEQLRTSNHTDELSAALRDVDSAFWSVRAKAGHRLAASAEISEVAGALGRLLLDSHDSAVVQETAAALLARRDTRGLRLVLVALATASEPQQADHIYATLASDPQWVTDDGPDQLISRLQELSLDPDPAVQGEAKTLLASMPRPHR